MKARPTLATLTASGPNQPIFMHCDPNMLYQMLFGSIAEGDIKKHYQARSDVMLEVEHMAKLKLKGLPQSESERYEKYVNGFRDLNGLREKLSKISGQLRKYAPKLDDRYSKPKFETDWHDALLEIGIAALQANLTNVLTIASDAESISVLGKDWACLIPAMGWVISTNQAMVFGQRFDITIVRC